MRRIEKQTIGSGDWLTLARIYYEGHDGVTRTWETVNRKNSRGAVGILATMKDSGEIVLIRQYRPPLDRFAIEFPAGLIDDGEEPGEAALRELRGRCGCVYPPGTAGRNRLQRRTEKAVGPGIFLPRSDR